MIFTIALLGVILVLSFIFIKGKYNEGYWNKRGVIFHSQNKVAGPIVQFAKTNRPLFDIYHDIYAKYPKEPAVGLGSFVNPNILIRDPENLQHIMQNDFPSFYHRGTVIHEKDLLSDNIVFMNGVRWKLTRQTMTPLFTATKLKSMYYILDKGAQDFVAYLKTHPEVQNGKAYDTLTSFCSAAVAAAVFGISTESIFKSPFLEMARGVVKPSLWSTIKQTLSNINPRLNKILSLRTSSQYEDFFIGAVKQLLRQREKESISRHDFADICIKIQQGGTIVDRDTGYKLEPTDELLAAQGFFFFVAGVDPCATAMFATLVELGRNPDVFKKVQEEIDAKFEKYEGEMSYDVLAEMDYLDRVISEAMRKHPPVGILFRKCMKESVLPVGNIKIDPGTSVVLPIFDIHHDPKYFPNPDQFDPDRFIEMKNDAYYMPFGKGNRICIGARYARLQVKTGLVHLLRQFSIETIELENEKKYEKQLVQVRMQNVNCRFIPRKLEEKSI